MSKANTKVTRKRYDQINNKITHAIGHGLIPGYAQQKRSKLRNKYYNQLAKLHYLSHSTVNNIARSRDFDHFRDLQNVKSKGRKLKVIGGDKRASRVNPRKLTTRELFVSFIQPMRSTIADQQEDITKLYSDLAIIKSKKKRWFK